MKKNYSTKIFRTVIIVMISITSLFIVFFSSRAEDNEDNNEEADNQYEDYRPTVTVPQIPSPLPIITSSQNSNSNVLDIFRDSDQDGITDAIDRHPGEDDFSYSLIDSNNNGIADDLEILIK